MTKPYYLALILSLGLAACAAEFTDSSDSNHVTFLNSNGSSMAELTKKHEPIVSNMEKSPHIEVAIRH